MENTNKNCKKKKSNCSPQKPPCLTTQLCPSLRDLCIVFVGRNIHLVDSLVDFPEIIGRELYDAACTAEKFTRPCNEAVSILGVFNEAYEEEILSELNAFVRRHVALESSLECVQTFIYLRKLDIEGCHIGDDHDLIPWIGNLQRLTHLGLGDNALSNDGIRKLTSPLRMFANGPVGLKVLSLKHNPKITEGVIRYLTCLKTLDALDVTGCSITTKGVIKLQSLGFTLSETDVPVFCALCTTCGWAADMVATWATAEDKVTGSKVKPRDNTKPTAMSFYSTHGRRLALASTLPQKCSPKPSKRLQLTRTVDSNTSTNTGRNLIAQRMETGKKLIKGNSQSSNRKKGQQWSKVEIQRHLFQPGGESNDKRTNSDHVNNDNCDKPQTSNNKPDKQRVSKVREPVSSNNMDILQGYLVDKSGGGGQPNTLWDVMKQW